MTAQLSSDEVARVAAGLSDGARATVCDMSGEWQAGPEMVDTSYLKVLRQDGLIEREFGDMSAPQVRASSAAIEFHLSACWWFRLTPLGLAVRQHLIEQEKGG